MAHFTQVCLRLPQDVVDQFNILAGETDASRSTLMRRAIEFGLPFVRHDHIINPSRVAVVMEIAYAAAEKLFEENGDAFKNSILQIAQERFIKYHQNAA